MRWYEINSEQLEPLVDVILAYRKRVAASMESAKRAGMVRAYEMESHDLARIDAALGLVGEVRKTDNSC